MNLDRLAKKIGDEIPEIRYEMIHFVLKEGEKIREEFYELQRKFATQLKSEMEASQQNLGIEARLEKMRHMLFGRGREGLGKSTAATPNPAAPSGANLFHSQCPFELDDKKAKEKSNLEHASTEHDMSAEELNREATSRFGEDHASLGEFVELRGFYDESFEYDVRERAYVKVCHRRKKYKFIVKPGKGQQPDQELSKTVAPPLSGSVLEKEVEEKTQHIVTAPGPVKLMPGAHYSVDFALRVVLDKYLLHLPLERQRKEIERGGLKVSVKTLFNLCQAVSVHMEPAVESIRQSILGGSYCPHMDESTWPIQDGKENGQMWILSSNLGAYYRFEPSRSGKVAEEILGDYVGNLLVDGYGGYDRFRKKEKVKISFCWSHARREFFDCYREDPTYEPNVELIKLLDDLFAVEREASNLDELKVLRREKSAPLVEKIFNQMKLMEEECLPKSTLRKAINYVSSRKKEFLHFLKDPTIPLSNNDAERGIRHAVVGRKNFYGSKNYRGADVAAILYSVIETCRRLNLDARLYMKHVVEKNWRHEKAPSPFEFAAEKFLRLNKTAA